MSIEVTCSCTKTYRLPDRYAGKRCRCRDCGERIEVPADGEEQGRGKSKAKSRSKTRKSKDDRSRTTRRLSSQDNEILGERRRLRTSQRTTPVSESMHQLAPMTLSGELPAAPARARKKAAARAESSSATATVTRTPPGRAARPRKKSSTEEARRGRRGERDEAPRSKGGSKAKKGRARDDGDTTDDVGPPPARKAGARAERKASKLAGGAQAGRARRGGKRDSREDDAPARARATKKPHNLPLLIGIAGALCLGVGLVIGGLVSGGSQGATASKSAGDLEARFARVDACKGTRDWAQAKAELDGLAAELRAAGDEKNLARAKQMSATVDAMVQIAAIEDDETKVATLVKYSGDRDPALRLGVVMELKHIPESEQALETLAGLTADPDAKVAEQARLGLIHAGGPHAIPFLGPAIEQAAASGHKLGDIALERALEINEPEVVPVLVTALKVRSGASPAVLKRLLAKLAEFCDPSCKDAVTPYASHADAGVKAAAEKVLEAVR